MSFYSDPKYMKERVILGAKGFCIGTADIIPGVSGGTMAFILGIYVEFIAAIKSFDLAGLMALLRLDFKTAISRPHFGFIVPLFLGIVAALLFFTRVVKLPQLLVEYPQEIYGLFFGLIAGSILVLLAELKGSTSMKEIIMLSVGILSGFILFNLVPVQTPEAGWFIFIAGTLAICAMMLPGISGSFVLLILNKYAYIFDAVGYFKLSVLLPFAAGTVVGLVFFSRLLSYILEHYYRLTVFFITGLLVASLSVIWPFRERINETVGGSPGMIDANPVFPPELSQSVLISLALVITGFIIVLGLNQLKSGVRSHIAHTKN